MNSVTALKVLSLLSIIAAHHPSCHHTAGTDRECNLVMAEGEEHGKVDPTQVNDGSDEGGGGGSIEDGGLEMRRRLGLTMVPGKHIDRIAFVRS